MAGVIKGRFAAGIIVVYEHSVLLFIDMPSLHPLENTFPLTYNEFQFQDSIASIAILYTRKVCYGFLDASI